MIELVSADRCIACDKCILVCPTDVFDRGADGIPEIARGSDCQTCFQCEANCPADALYVSPRTEPDESARDLDAVGAEIGGYRARIGWGHGRVPAPAVAVGPAFGADGAAIIS
ncbi:ferredoxin family protein [Tsukamurella sp. 8F]|uniref:4Fe-4S dicluster domain-containing protein n=1 Tax=unclassified Tsukamurella TaxID=2633480 RepID=UPI0023BA0BE2|nr:MULTISPECIES: ferredoxin family protein [unclassified Tsukamurella]MDF0530985.1 ferredoxin family protein [Tsukamurella sp. 8J]MDF0588686.1 ferredoxin family protein [Tsukamurella sp. 8F]